MSGIATFPLLRTGELVASLVDIGLPVSADDVDRPTASKVVPLYSWFLNALTQLTLEDVMVAAQLTLDNMAANPDLPTELLRETVYVGALHATLNQVMQWACLDDFSVKDIRDPQPARLRRILSALLNFYLFEQDQMPRLAHLEESSEELAKEEHDYERKMVELQDAIERKKCVLPIMINILRSWVNTPLTRDRRAALDLSSQQAAEIEEKNASTRHSLLEKRSQASALSNGIESTKHDRSALQSKVEDLSQSLSTLDLDINRLRSRIVQSPGRVKAVITDLSHNVASMKEDIATHESRGRDHALRISVLRAYEGQISAVLAVLAEWESELQRASVEHGKIVKLTELRESQSELLKNRELKVAQAKRRIAVVEEQRERHERQAESKRETLSAKLSELQSMHEHLMAKRQDADEEAAKRHKAIALKEKEVSPFLHTLTESEAHSQLCEDFGRRQRRRS